MKRYIFAGFMIIIAAVLFAADLTAVVKDVSGKVEVMSPGGSWKKASTGMKIETGDSISTGFRSQAILTLGASQVVVKQLTRMELTELVEKQGTVRTGLNLRVGKIKAKVRTTAGLRQDFRLTSPVSTAAVRGTDFEYDGVNLKVLEGSVEFTNKRGQRRLVPAGVASKIIGTGLPQSGEELKNLLISIDPSTLTIPQDFDISDFLDFLGGSDGLTDVTIIINWEA